MGLWLVSFFAHGHDYVGHGALIFCDYLPCSTHSFWGQVECAFGVVHFLLLWWCTYHFVTLLTTLWLSSSSNLCNATSNLKPGSHVMAYRYSPNRWWNSSCIDVTRSTIFTIYSIHLNTKISQLLNICLLRCASFKTHGCPSIPCNASPYAHHLFNGLINHEDEMVTLAARLVVQIIVMLLCSSILDIIVKRSFLHHIYQ